MDAADPRWEGVGVVATVVISVLVVVWEYLRRHRKVLAYDIPVFGPVVEVRKEFRDRIKVLFDGEQVSSLWSAVVFLRNARNQPITTSDFERPLTLTTGSGRLLDVRIRTHPTTLRPQTTSTPGLVIQPLLLNPGDALLISLMIDSGNLNFDARIAGIVDIDIDMPSRRLLKNRQ